MICKILARQVWSKEAFGLLGGTSPFKGLMLRWHVTICGFFFPFVIILFPWCSRAGFFICRQFRPVFRNLEHVLRLWYLGSFSAVVMSTFVTQVSSSVLLSACLESRSDYLHRQIPEGWS